MRDKFWDSPIYNIVRELIARGNQESPIDEWVSELAAWAAQNKGKDAEAVRAWAPLWRSVPFMSAAELAPLMPALAVHLGFSARFEAPVSSNRLEHQLKRAGLPMLQRAIPYQPLFEHNGKLQLMFIVNRIGYWRGQSLSQERFDYVLFHHS